MHQQKNTYRQVLKGCILFVCLFAFTDAIADDSQSLTNLTLQTIQANAGDAALAAAYNPNKNEYLLVYSDFDASCPTNQELRGQFINSVTGEKKGNPLNLTTSEQPCAFQTKLDPKVVYNDLENEYFILFKNSTSLGAQIKYVSIDANTLQASSEAILDSDEIADPFENCSLELDASSNIYALGYHKENALSESFLTLKFINGSTKSISTYTQVFDKNDFGSGNKGVFGSKIIYNGDLLMVSFEVKFTSGSEIHGVLINPQTEEIIGDIFQISPDGSSTTHYINPSMAFNDIDNELLVVFEEARAIGGNYALNYKIHGQKINSSTGNLLTPLNAFLTEIPTSPFTEDSKRASVCFSPQSGEFIISFYGIRYAAGSDIYNLYLQRVRKNDLSSINPSSTEVIDMIGTEVVGNNQLKSIPLAFNTINNQYLLGWNTETDNDIQTQIWRYDNNPPKDLAISNTTIAEELPIGSTFAAISATDPDPEDNSLEFTLVSGSGSQDNSFFSIEGNALKTSKRISFEESTSRSVRIRATDLSGAFTEKQFVITITNIKEAPKNLALQPPFTIQENLPPNTYTTSISVEDEDLNSTITYALIAGDSSVNNSNFKIESGTNQLKLIASINYEDTPRQYVRIRAADETGLYVEKGFTFIVEDVNEGPESLFLTPTSLPENDAQSKAIIDVIDPDNSSNYLFSKPPSGGEDDNDSFLLSGNELRPLVQLNFERKSQYTVRLRASDGTYDTTQTLLITVTDVNDDPDSIRLSENRIVVGEPAGTLIGNLTTFDQDVNDTHFYTLVNGADLFFINGSELRALNSMTYDNANPENNEYSITIKSTDSQGGEKLEDIIIEVVLIKDEEKPVIFDFIEISYVDENAASTVLSINTSDNEALDTVQFFYRQIRSAGSFIKSNDLLTIDKQNDKLYFVDANVDLSLFDEMGIEYYFKVKDAAGNYDSIKGYAYKSFIKKQFTPTASSFDGTLESYKIIANPYDIESTKVSKIFSDYGSSTDQTWRLFSYQNKVTKEVGTKTSESMNQGRGYWFNKMESLPQGIEFENAKVPKNNQDNLYSINLVKGWNLIGNPYPFTIQWADVLAHNGYAEIELVTFDKVYNENSVELKEFEGGYIFVENAINNFEFPLSINSGARIAKYANEDNPGWAVNFILDDGSSQNTLGGIGMHEQAQASYDKHDRPLLPRFIDQLEISFSHPEHFSKAFSKDVVALEENHIWEFVVSATKNSRDILLSWNVENGPKSTNQLVLYDVLRDKKTNMKKEFQYSFTSEQTATFKAIYGDEAFIRDALDKIRIEALQPYPNPFSDQVTIPVNLPYSTNTYEVETHMYDLLGELVFEQKLEKLQHGLLQLEWTADQNKKLKQGIYIYSIKVKNGFLTNTFHGRVVKN